MDELSSSLKDKIGLIQVDLMLHFEFIDEGDLFV